MTADDVLQQQQERSPTILEAHLSFIAVKVVPNERRETGEDGQANRAFSSEGHLFLERYGNAGKN
jgi:hypothetical protein